MKRLREPTWRWFGIVGMALALAACSVRGGGGAISAADGVFVGEGLRSTGPESRCERRYALRATLKLGELAMEFTDSENPTRTPVRASSYVEANGRFVANVFFQGESHVLEGVLSADSLRATIDARSCRMSISARRNNAV
ncbi:MAG: hypothetical protein O9320_20035 [Magnetospirillum sp.]|jgi:hypothetical protein|nr:hypothetical protein [Magnetospirillum sp.]